MTRKEIDTAAYEISQDMPSDEEKQRQIEAIKASVFFKAYRESMPGFEPEEIGPIIQHSILVGIQIEKNKNRRKQ